MVESLNTPEVSKILNEMMGGTATILEKTYVQIYTADEGKHHYHGSNISGICCLIFDRREGKVAYLRVYDSSNLQVIFSIELYYGFLDCWVQQLPNFYSVPYFRGFIGFLFPNVAEAQKMTNRIASLAPKQEDFDKRIAEIKKHEEDQKKALKKEKEKHTVFGQVKGLFGGDKEERKEMSIGAPKGFQHTSSLKFDNLTGEIDINNLPAEYLEIFKRAGVTKKDLQDKNTAREIFKTVALFNEDPQTLNTKQQTPPPPPPPPPPAPKPIAQNVTSTPVQQAVVKQTPPPLSFLAEIQAGKQLKSVQVSKNEAEIKLKDLDKVQQENLSDYLGRMMAERRAQLNKNKKDSSGSDGNWSDD